MSVSRDVIADVIGVPEDNVRCDNCDYSRRFVGNMHLCNFWNDQWTKPDAFCSFFKERKVTDAT